MRVLLVGGGGRECAIAHALKENPDVKLFAAMLYNNPSIYRLCGNTDDNVRFIDETRGENIDVICNWAKEKNIDIAVIGLEDPLSLGISDRLEEGGIDCVGPKAEVAKLETDKTFARSLMKEYRIEGLPEFEIFDNAKDAIDFLKYVEYDFVIKPAGLTGGKGVKIMGEQLKGLDDARSYVKEIFKNQIGKLNKIVIEEKLVGEEFTLQAFVDGKNVVGMPMVQDHKRADEGDIGPNTGGMGSYSDAGYILPFLTQEDYDKGLEIMKKAINAVKQKTEVEYKGFLYGQFMVGRNGPKLIEFNARLGDPEAMNVLPILESDFTEICWDIIEGNLRENNIRFAKKATVCKYIVPKGYGRKPQTEKELSVDERGLRDIGAKLYYAKVNETKDGKILTTTSRSIGLVGISDSIEEAEKIAEKAINYINGIYDVRHDIGTRELIDKRMRHMAELRPILDYSISKDVSNNPIDCPFIKMTV